MPHPVFQQVAKHLVKHLGEKTTIQYTKYETEDCYHIKAIFNPRYAEFDVNGVQVSEKIVTIHISDAEFRKLKIVPDAEDIVVMYGTRYFVEAIDPDGFGITKLNLRKEYDE